MVLKIETQARSKSSLNTRSVEYCFKCSVCSLVCPVTLYGKGYTSTQSFVYNVFTFDPPAANPNLWYCVLCHKCTETCPQGFEPPEVIERLKGAAFRNGWAPAPVVTLVESVIKTGFSFPLTASTNNMRKKLNLPPLSTQSTDDIATIVENTGLKELLANLKSERADGK